MKKVVRKPSVSGSFYPRDPLELKEQIQGFLAQASRREQTGPPQILIVPHAGYQYSGPVAAAGFQQLSGLDFPRVILIGSSHQSWFAGAAIDQSQAWQTPLGEVKTDHLLAEKLAAGNDDCSFSAAAHRQEHSLEVELPFLQAVLPDFQLVPILLGQIEERQLDQLVETISANLSPETLLVVSSDLSHYPDYQTAQTVDQLTLASILSGRPEDFLATIASQMKKGYPQLETCACGEKAIVLALKIAARLGSGRWQLFQYANSGDMTGGKARVVGYASLGFFLQPSGSAQELLNIARKTLIAYLQDKTIPDFKISDPQLLEPRGAFVTLKKDNQLRGCLGEFASKEPLWKVIRQMVIAAASQDPRFPPVRLNELEEIKIEISVLSPLKRIDSPEEIKLGLHGVMIEKGGRRGVFLPQVATETGWSRKEFLNQLCRQKAGLAANCWQDKDAGLSIFTSKVYEE